MDRLPRDGDGRLCAFAWPGGYPIFYLDRDNETLCPACAQKELDEWREDLRRWVREEVREGRLLRTTTLAAQKKCEQVDRRSLPTGWFIHWEGPPEVCSACNGHVESAYGIPGEE